MNPKQINDYQYFAFLCSTKNIPLDYSFSIPLAILLEIGNEPSLSFDVFKTALFSKLEDFIFRTQYSEDDTLNYQAIKDDNLKKIYNGLLNYQQLLIPEIVVNSKLLKENNMDGIENLFI